MRNSDEFFNDEDGEADDQNNSIKAQVTSRISESGGDSGISRKKIGTLFALISIIVSGYATRPWWHEFIYSFVSMPMVWLTFLTGVGIVVTGVKLPEDTRSDRKQKMAVIALGILLIGGTLVTSIIGHSWIMLDKNEDIEQNNASAELEDMPEIRENSTRMLPRAVARNYVTSSFQYPRHRPANGDITHYEGKTRWSFMMEPNGFIKSFIYDGKGIAFVDMTTDQKKTIAYEQQFSCSPGQAFRDDSGWNFKKNAYWVDYKESDQFAFVHNGEGYIAVPYETHEWKIGQPKGAPFPWPYSEPQFGGVALMDTDCNIEMLSADEAVEDPRLENQNFRPYSYEEMRVSSRKYKDGLANRFFWGYNLFELANVPGEGNEQPFTIPTKEGKQYIFTGEPEDSGSGMFKLWWVDAQTGDVNEVTFNKTSTLYGPERAANRVQERPEVSKLSNGKIREVIPQPINGTLHWQVHIVPESYSGVTYYGIVNANTGDVKLMETSGQVYKYLSEDTKETIEEETGGVSENETVTIVTVPNESGDDAEQFVVIKDEETGEVKERIPLDEDETVVVKQNVTTSDDGENSES